MINLSSGIDWQGMSAEPDSFIHDDDPEFSAPALTPAAGEPACFYDDPWTLDMAVSRLERLSEFGTVRSLSSPRVTIMNNQSVL